MVIRVVLKYPGTLYSYCAWVSELQLVYLSYLLNMVFDNTEMQILF